MAYQRTETPKNKRRDELSKFDGMEAYYRGGVEVGYQMALADVRAALELAERHVLALETWATSDPAIERDAPVLSLEAVGAAQSNQKREAKR